MTFMICRCVSVSYIQDVVDGDWASEVAKAVHAPAIAIWKALQRRYRAPTLALATVASPVATAALRAHRYLSGCGRLDMWTYLT